MGEGRGTSTSSGARADASRTQMNVHAVVPPPPTAGDSGSAAAPEAFLPAASSTMLFQKGFATPKPGQTTETAASQEPTARGPRRKQLSVTRPAWISNALDGAGGGAAPDARVQLGPGTKVPGTRYRITRWLGDGGMGVVYEAEHVDLGRKAALKVLRAELCRNPEALSMFREEARAASRLGHDNIVDVFDFAELPDGRLLFAMEMLEGQSLAAALRPDPIPFERAVGILRQICQGLSVAHDANIVHRDVKPDNVVIETRRGRSDFVKILDFGIATIVGESAQGPISAGSPYYLAPELVSGLPFDHRVDIYALGCTAYEMLTGVPPLRGETVEDVLRAHLEGHAPPPSQLNPTIPPALDRVVMRCLAKNQDDRYENMRDLEAALCEAQIEAGFATSWDDLPLPQVGDARRERLVAEMPSAATTMVMRRPRSRAWLAVAAVALLATGAGVAWTLRASDEAAAAADSQLNQLVRSARQEAALHYYVYPPADRPDQKTAYAVVREIEALPGGAAVAGELRGEFAATLVRLGDRYWDAEGGKAFAIDYYAQALVFAPESPRAVERGTLTPGQLAALEEKAAKGSFSDSELAAAEPLAALAEEDEGLRDEKLEQLSEREDLRSASSDAQLEKLVGKRLSRARPARRAPAPSVLPEAEAEPEPASKPSAKDGYGKAKEAAALAKAGTAALASGDRGQARKLFERALGRDRRNAEALIGLSDVEFSSGNYHKAVRHGQRAVKQSPRNASYQLKLGDALYKVMRYEEAHAAYEAAGKLGDARAERRMTRVSGKLAG